MHIPDGILNPYTCIIMFGISLIFLIWAWKTAKRSMSRIFIPLAATLSAVILIVQMVEFPVAGGGSTWHIMGGTLVTMILGPGGSIISSTIVLIIQALAFGDGGITSFGANVFNMAVIGAFSFFVEVYRKWEFKQKAARNSLIYSSMVVKHSDCFGCRHRNWSSANSWNTWRYHYNCAYDVVLVRSNRIS